MGKDNQKTIVQFLAISYTFTWLIWLPGVLASYGLIPDVSWLPLFTIGICGPLVASLWCLHRTGGWPEVKLWLRLGFSRRFGWQWWMVIVFVPLVIPALALGIFTLLGGEIAPLLILEKPWGLLPTLVLMVTIGGGQEEFGWRGFLLPLLLKEMKTWQANLLMIFAHALWHIPLFFITYTIQSQYSFWLFLVFGIGFTPLINQVYRGTGNSILAAILFHGITNTGLDMFPPVGAWVNHSSMPLLLIGAMYLLVYLAAVQRRVRSGARP